MGPTLPTHPEPQPPKPQTKNTGLLLEVLTLFTFAKFEVLLVWNNSRILAVPIIPKIILE